MRQVALGLAGGGLLSQYSRQDEYAADDMAHLLVRRAGYSTQGLVSFLRKIQNLERGGHPLPFLSSHPPTPERIGRLEILERGVLPMRPLPNRVR